jgi:hypothetical protein
MATGEHWGYQRCGRYAYWRVLTHSTNPDHLVASTPSLTDTPTLDDSSPVPQGLVVHREREGVPRQGSSPGDFGVQAAAGCACAGGSPLDEIVRQGACQIKTCKPG